MWKGWEEFSRGNDPYNSVLSFLLLKVLQASIKSLKSWLTVTIIFSTHHQWPTIVNHFSHQVDNLQLSLNITSLSPNSSTHPSEPRVFQRTLHVACSPWLWASGLSCGTRILKGENSERKMKNPPLFMKCDVSRSSHRQCWVWHTARDFPWPSGFFDPPFRWIYLSLCKNLFFLKCYFLYVNSFSVYNWGGLIMIRWSKRIKNYEVTGCEFSGKAEVSWYEKLILSLKSFKDLNESSAKLSNLIFIELFRFNFSWFSEIFSINLCYASIFHTTPINGLSQVTSKRNRFKN